MLEGGVEECEGGEGGDKCEGGEGTERRLRVLERVLKTLENVRYKFIYYISVMIIIVGASLSEQRTNLLNCHCTKQDSLRTQVDI